VHRHSRISRIVKVQLYLTKFVLMPPPLFYSLCPPYGKLPRYFESSQLFSEEICHLLSSTVGLWLIWKIEILRIVWTSILAFVRWNHRDNRTLQCLRRKSHLQLSTWPPQVGVKPSAPYDLRVFRNHLLTLLDLVVVHRGQGVAGLVVCLLRLVSVSLYH
jgi:hypothetical protein